MKTTPEQRAKWARIAESRLDVRSNLERQGRISREAIPALLADLEEAREDLEKDRLRIHDLETICDPAGLTIENAQSKDQLAALQIMYRNAADDLAATRKQLAEVQAQEPIAWAVYHGIWKVLPSKHVAEEYAKNNFGDIHPILSDVPGSDALSAAITQAVEPYKLDAERYQQLRRGQHWSVINGIGEDLRADELDAAIDALAAKEAP